MRDLRSALKWGSEAFDYMPGKVSAVVATRLVVPVRGPKISHELAHREKQEPNTIFVGMLTNDRYDRLRAEAESARRDHDAAVRRSIEEMKPLASRTVHWEDLTAKQQARLQGQNLSIKDCWIWRPLPHLRRKIGSENGARKTTSPYAEFYKNLKCPIPDGVHLRHKCDNPLCMNPNHLEPGTAADNVKDMMDRGRHYRQVIARKRAKKRDAYKRRKEQGKSLGPA